MLKMSYYKISSILLLLVLFCGCADEHKSKKTIPTKVENKENTRTAAEKVIIPDGGASNFDFSQIQKISQKELKPFLREYGKKNPETKVQISTDYGKITVQLFTDTPLHRANFIHLVKLGYFNTTFFHRVDEGFVIQGGNSDQQITQKVRAAVGDFLIPNEADPNHPHVRGAFSMAKYSEQNISNASSPFEFFIVQNKNGAHHLDGKHTVFGKVIDGMDVVDEINQLETGKREWPVKNVFMEIKILE